MTLTEEEAKTKRCCGPSNAGETVFIAPDDYAVFHNCIGSGCMGWRWCEEHNIEAMEHYEACAPGIPSTPPRPVGYCGLAGKP